MTATTATHRWLPGPDPAIAYRSNDGAPDGSSARVGLVLLHGLSADSTSYAPVMARFARDRRTAALDFRGHGRSEATAGHYRLDDYVDDAQRLLEVIGEPAVVAGHSLGGVVAAELAQRHHPLVAAVYLEDPPLYLVEPSAFDTSSFARVFGVLRDHIVRLQDEQAPVERYRDLLAASPHPAGDKLGDHLYEDALWSRAGALASMDPAAITAVLDGTTFGDYEPDRSLACPAVVLRADPTYDAAFVPADEARLHVSSPDARVVAMPGAGHNIRGDRATRHRYLDTLGDLLAAVAEMTVSPPVGR